MKLRNKKIIDVERVNKLIGEIRPEPLFKDEKIGEAVKNWVLTNYKNHMIIEFDNNMNGFYMFMENTDLSLCGISFQPDIELGLEEREYTFDELCGEEE